MNARAFHHRLFNALTGCLGPNKSIVCAVSGGIDSAVLLHGLNEVNRRKRMGLTLHVGHVDHGLRADSADVAEWVRRLAQSMGLNYAMQRVNVPTLARQGGGSVEEVSRTARYAALERMAIEAEAGCVAAAHHADDQAETVLHHLLRGTGLAGLAAMPPVRPMRNGSPVSLIRPMLDFTREEIQAYAVERGLSFREDETNSDTSLTRNRIRRELLPLLRAQFNPRVAQALVRLANHARDGVGVIAASASDLLARATVGLVEGVLHLDVPTLSRASGGLSSQALREAFLRLEAPLQSLDTERLAAVRSLLEGGGRRRTIELPGRFAAQRRGRFLLIGPAGAIAAARSRAKPAITAASKLRRVARSSR